MPWTVQLFRDRRNHVPVRDWLRGVPRKPRADFFARLKDLHERGNEVDRPLAEHVYGAIWALRLRFERIRYRVFYFFDGRTVVLTHAIQKDSARIPPEEIRRAERYREEYLADPENHTWKGLS